MRLGRFSSLRSRLLALGLMPLVVLLPFVLAALHWTGSRIVETQMESMLRGNLAGTRNFLDQLRVSTQEQVGNYAKSSRMAALRRGAAPAEVEQALQAAARGWGLAYLTLATPEGVVIASSAGLRPGSVLPDSHVLRQARFGLGSAAFERFELQDVARFSPAFENDARVLADVGGEGAAVVESRGLLLNAAAPLPLSVELPDAILVGGQLVNNNTALVERIREIVFPVESTGDDDGMVALHLDEVVVARSRSRDQEQSVVGSRHSPQIAEQVLLKGGVWIGQVRRDGASYMAGYSPIADGEGRRIGMLGVALPDAQYTARWLKLLALVSGLLALAMLAISVIFLHVGREMTGRIQALDGAMRAVRQGVRGSRIGQSAPDDELGRLARNYDEMQETIERQESELKQRHAELQHLSANVPGALFQYRQRADGSAGFPYASAGIEGIYGLRPDEAAGCAERVLAVVHPGDHARVAESIRASAERLLPWHEVYRVRHPVKGLIWVEGSATPERDAHDGSTIWHGYLRDVSAEQHTREQLKLAASVYATSQEGILITDARHVIIDMNEACALITGFGREEALGCTPAIFRSGHHAAEFYAEREETLQREGRWKGEVWNRHRNGALYVVLLSITAVHDDAGEVTHYISILTDISPLKARQSELDRLANYDALTGIPNRRLLADRLGQAIAQARRDGGSLAVCMMDLDGFKPVNDTHGHEAGDLLLIEISRRLTRLLRSDDTVARLGGDEFVMVFRNPGPGTEVFDRVLQAVAQPVEVRGMRLSVSASLGVSYLDAGAQDGEQLLREADMALYESKRQGRDRVSVFQR